jgi:hypothetical protein
MADDTSRDDTPVEDEQEVVDSSGGFLSSLNDIDDPATMRATTRYASTFVRLVKFHFSTVKKSLLLQKK